MKTSFKRTALIFSFALMAICSFAVPAFASSYFDITLPPWHGKAWVGDGYKSSWRSSYYVELAKDSPNEGHFWVDNSDGTSIAEAVDVRKGEGKWGAYQGSGIKYGGYATIYGREIGYGPLHDKVKGWFNLNG